MNKREYNKFERAVYDFMKKEGINCLTSDHEPSFGWNNCDCCGSDLGGDRYDATGYNPEHNEVYEYSVCKNCVYYAAYGQLDDETILSLAEEK